MAVLTIEPAQLIARPPVRDTPGLALRTLDLARELETRGRGPGRGA